MAKRKIIVVELEVTIDPESTCRLPAAIPDVCDAIGKVPQVEYVTLRSYAMKAIDDDNE